MKSNRRRRPSRPVVRASASSLLGTLERLLEIQATDERAALTEASNVILGALGGDKVDVFLYDPSIDSLIARGTSETPMGKKQHELGLDRLSIANGGRSVLVFRGSEPHLSGRADRDALEVKGLVRGLGIHSRLVVPLDVEKERRGTLEVAAAEPNRFGETDLRFLQAAARWMGAFLHRLELVARMQESAAAEGRRTAAEDILTVLAHDLRNVLAPAAGRVALLRDRALRDEREADVRDTGLLEASLRRLVQMTNNLLDVSRLERGLFSLDLRLVDAVTIARQAVMAVRREGVRIEENYPQSATVNADPDRLSRALENLIGNAIKHSPPGGIVQVRMELGADPPQCVVQVIDEGPGIPPHLLPRIFDRFVAGEGSRGLGLGLYLARGIASAHGGTLTVKQSGKGALFELCLPLLE